MRSYLVCSLVIAMVAAAGCGDNRPSAADARDTAGDGVGDGSSNDRADVGTGTGGATAGTGGATAGTGGATGGTGGSGGVGGTGGATAGTGGGVDGGDAGGSDGGGTPTCSDGIKNSDETDVDCGGHCGKCAPDKQCLVNADCGFACRADKTCAACTVGADCSGPENECVHRTCTAGVCGSMRENAGTVLEVQTIGDCKRRQCAGDGTVATANDDTDVPDDRNPCTNDICSAGAASHTMMPQGSNCGGANHCNATGQCIGCTVATDCPGNDTTCRTRICATGGVCTFQFAVAGTKLVDPMAKDCKGMQCDGAGNEQVVNDNTDLPVDGNVCTTDECSLGTPANRPVTAGNACGGSLVCDGASKCVECLSASTCPGTDADCHARSCVAGACGVSNMAMGTMIAAQAPRDCKKTVCDGQGGTSIVNDPLDLPVDGNSCTQDVCAEGIPSNPFVTAGNSCGTNTVCDGQGACVTCLTPSTCPGSDTECHHRTCINGTCGMALVAAGTPLAMQNAGDCKVSQCDGTGQGVIVNDDNDKPVDGNPCTADVCTAGVATNPTLSTGTTCGTNLMCNGQGACVGCITAANCGTDTPCQTHTCTNGTCGVNNAAAGTPLPASMQTDRNCRRVQCDGLGQSTTVNDDADLPVDGNACTKDLCNGGIASNPPEDAGTACNMGNGNRCNGSGTAPACVQCLQPTDCTGSDTECHHRTCTNGVCGIANTADGTPLSGSMQMTGDCKKNVCMGGNPMSVNDDVDVPEDSNACTTDLCTTGTPSHMFVAADAPCSEGGGTRCNGSGACVQCLNAGQCGTDSVCRTFTCDTGRCTTHDVPNATALPPAMQMTGDCKTKVCNGTGGITDASDDTDVRVDGNACTDDNCSNGVATNPPLDPNTPCSQGGGTRCNGSATAPACVQCLQDNHCGTNTTCKMFHCNAGLCSSSDANDGTPVSDDPGDCKKTVCMSGAAAQINDNNDVYVDGNPCTDDQCMDGVPQNPNVAAGMSCGGALMCDGGGNCVGCIIDANCPPPPPNSCLVSVCNAGSCGFTFKPVGTPVADALGNCHTVACDDSGNPVSVVDTNDTPSTNGNECLQGVCSAEGVPSLAPRAVDFACTQGTGVVCDGAGQCVECNNANQCPQGNGTECETATCNGGVCDIFRPLAGVLTLTQTPGDCQDSICDGAGHPTTTNNTLDLPSNTNDCRTAMCSGGTPSTPSTPPKPHGTTCAGNNGRTCDSAGNCLLTFNVVRIGDGSPLVGGQSAAVFIEERRVSDGMVIGSPIPLPTMAGNGNLAYSNSGSANTEGGLSLSVDGRYVTLVGYNAAPGQGAVATTANINRLVARVDASGGVDTTTRLTAFIGDNVRGATTQDGSVFWVGGGSSGTSGGVWSVALGSTGAGTQIATTPVNATYPHIFGGQLFLSAGTGTTRSPLKVGTGTPTMGPPVTPTTLTGLPTATASPNSYVFFDRIQSVGDPAFGGGAFDTLYIADNGSAAFQGIEKWTYTGTSATCPGAVAACWVRGPTFNLSPAVGYRGLAGLVTGSNVTLVASTADAAPRLVVFVDDGTANPAGSVIGTSTSTQIFRGVAFSPHL